MAHYTFHSAVFQTCSFQNSNRRGSYAMRSINLCQTSQAFLHISVSRFSRLCFPKGMLQNQISPVEENELVLCFLAFCYRASYCGSLFPKYFSRQITGQRGFPGHAIITDWVSSSLSLVPPGWFFVALSFRMKYLWPSVVVFSCKSPGLIAHWFWHALLPKYRTV